MISLLSVSLLGFFLGMRHATDSDHVIAVTTIVSKQRDIRGAALTGIFWGLGHSLTVLLFGGAIIFFGIVIPQRLGLSLELCVAVMLVLLGLLNLLGMARAIRDGGEPRDYDLDHALPLARMDAKWGGKRAYSMVRAALIGVMHGLAGSAAVALFVLPLIQNSLTAIAYLGVFGAGTIAGMMLITAAIAVPLTYAAKRFALFNRFAAATAGLLSVGFGAFLFWRIGFVEGLFTR